MPIAFLAMIGVLIYGWWLIVQIRNDSNPAVIQNGGQEEKEDDD